MKFVGLLLVFGVWFGPVALTKLPASKRVRAMASLGALALLCLAGVIVMLARRPASTSPLAAVAGWLLLCGLALVFTLEFLRGAPGGSR